MYADRIDIWYGTGRVDRLARLRGKGKHNINHRHIIDWLVRKPGAFERYLYRDALFPTSRFRMAYDVLCALHPDRGHKEYLKILNLAAKENETAVDEALHHVLNSEEPLSAALVEAIVTTERQLPSPREVRICPVCLAEYDLLLREEA